MDLRDLTPRRVALTPREVFPRFDRQHFAERFTGNCDRDQHRVVLATLTELWHGGYRAILERYGFHEPEYEHFSSHCHQITPALGYVLKARGYQVAYLEGMRVNPADHGEKYPPELEPSEITRPEFVKIGRIPYCCLEVQVDGRCFYVSGKHLRPGTNGTRATQVLLTPVCYEPMVGYLPHPDDPTRSGVYLHAVSRDPVIWMKQTRDGDGTPRDPDVEVFRTFAHFDLEW